MSSLTPLLAKLQFRARELCAKSPDELFYYDTLGSKFSATHYLLPVPCTRGGNPCLTGRLLVITKEPLCWFNWKKVLVIIVSCLDIFPTFMCTGTNRIVFASSS
jgi:hypothetical protein